MVPNAPTGVHAVGMFELSPLVSVNTVKMHLIAQFGIPAPALGHIWRLEFLTPAGWVIPYQADDWPHASVVCRLTDAVDPYPPGGGPPQGPFYVPRGGAQIAAPPLAPGAAVHEFEVYP